MGRRSTAWRLNLKSTPHGDLSAVEDARQQVKRLVRNPPKPVIIEEAGEPVRSWTYEPIDLQAVKGVTPVPARRAGWFPSIPSPHVF